jgi:site-specific recombinase XerD
MIKDRIIKAVKRGYKAPHEKFLEPDQVKQLLQEVNRRHEVTWRRDHALFYLSFSLGLRVSEAVRLCKENFRDIDRGIIYVPTLKSAPRLPVACSCGKRIRVSIARIGQEILCSRCGKPCVVTNPGGIDVSRRIPERAPPIVEEPVRAYAESYVSAISGDQNWLFVRNDRRDLRISADWARKLFRYYAASAGLSAVYSFHSLRHGRGVVIYDMDTRVTDVRDFLRQRSISSAEIYTHMSKRAQAGVRSRLEDMSRGVLGSGLEKKDGC